MTHTHTLPNGFSRDFSEAPDRDKFFIYAKAGDGFCSGKARKTKKDGRLVWAGSTQDVVGPLCWCPIPTPGDAVLKELAEEGE